MGNGFGFVCYGPIWYFTGDSFYMIKDCELLFIGGKSACLCSRFFDGTLTNL